MNDSTLSTILMLALMAVAFWFLLIRPAQKKQKAQQDMVNTLAEGARVMTTAGIFGTIRHLGERQAIIEIAPGVEMTLLKQGIMRVVPGSEEEFEYDESEDVDGEIDDEVDYEASTAEALEEQRGAGEEQIQSGFERPDKPENTSH